MTTQHDEGETLTHNYTKDLDTNNYEPPPNPTEMKNLYGRGYELMKQLGYSGKGCGVNEQGIHVSIEPYQK
jgi:hypothetical protein